MATTADPTASARPGAAPARLTLEPDRCGELHSHPARVARLRKALIADGAVADLADTFKVLGDATRVRLLDALSKAELCVCDLAALVGLTESAVSHQLRLLRGMRLVRARREGRLVFYTIDDDHILSLFRQSLRHVQEPAGAARGRRAAGGGER